MSLRHVLPPPRAVALALALAGAALCAVQAQTVRSMLPGSDVDADAAPSRVFNVGDYAANAAVGRVLVQVARDGIPADGQSAVEITVELFDRAGQPLASDAMITIEASAGRILLPGAKTDEFGPGRRDADRIVKGTQVRVSGGSTHFSLIAPDVPRDVLLRVTAGQAQAQGSISFVPALRPLVSIGVIEGVIRLSHQSSSLVQPVRLDDGFDQEIQSLSRSFDSGRGDAAGRAAFFLKGMISGDALLTASFDSDKQTRSSLLRNISPNEQYPVYGDSSAKTFDAQSSTKLYVRVDQNKSYVMYGDFVTGSGFSQATGGGAVASSQLRSLGAYNRTLTGVRGHWEQGDVLLNAFAARDTLKQIVQELRANGTSGPFTLSNNSALENSETVEILVRDKNNPGTILSITPLQPFDDYTFEPFSGRIVLNRPLPSVDANGNPESLRVTYEVDQGGEAFWVAGVDGEINLGHSLTVGGALVEDKNPQSPYSLASANASARVSDTTRVTAEVAHSTSTLWNDAGVQYTNPTFTAGELRDDQSGNAERLALQHKGATTQLDAYAVHTDAGFYNPSAPMQQGQSEASAKGSVKVNDDVKVFGEAIKSDNDLTGGERHGGLLGVEDKITSQWTVSAGVRKVEENAQWNGSANLIVPNATPGSTTNPAGGFYGGIDPVVVNPSTGLAQNSYAPLAAQAPAQGISINATTVFLGTQYRVNDRLTLQGVGEESVQGDDKYRFAGGASYQLAERSRLYAQYESQSGITSAYGAERSNVATFGADTSYMPGGQVFSEYRLRDATGEEAQWANGVRNTWSIRPGQTYTTSFEYLTVLSGTGASAAAATLGYDWTADPLWKLATKLEFRRVFNDPSSPTDEGSNSVLSTVTLARKLDRDWTLLTKNYLLFNHYDSAPLSSALVSPLPTYGPQSSGYNALQDRYQLGAAYRPVDDNRIDMLAKYEYKFSRNADSQLGLTERVNIASLAGTYHPVRPWWVFGHVAAKTDQETGLSADGTTSYNAWLVSGRVLFDVTENWDAGTMWSFLHGDAGNSRQYAYGVEAGYLVRQNLWLSAGFNFSGFADRDLTGSDYTNRGVYLRLRFKFDEDLFAGNNRDVNRALDRSGSASAGAP